MQAIRPKPWSSVLGGETAGLDAALAKAASRHGEWASQSQISGSDTAPAKAARSRYGGRKMALGNAEAPQPNEQIFQLHRTGFRAYAARCLQRAGDDPDVEDALVELGVRALSKWNKVIRSESSPKGWLFGTLKKICTEMLRRRRSQRPISLGDDLPDTGQESNPLIPAEQWELETVIRSCLDEFCSAWRKPYRTCASGICYQRLVVAVFYEGETVAEIARKTGESDSTLRYRLATALKKIRSCLTDKGYDPNALY